MYVSNNIAKVDCCEELHSDTIQFLVKRCNKLKRLGLKRFVKLNDSLVGDLVAAIPSLQYIEISICVFIEVSAVL